MNRTFYILLSLIFVIDINAQTSIIELPAEPILLSKVFEKLEKEHSFLCSFKEDDVRELVIIPPAKKLPIQDFLKVILINTELKFEILEDKYLIFSRKTPQQLLTERKEIKAKRICGKIIDAETGDPLSYANVYLKRTSQGIYSTENGGFEFRSLLEPNDTLVISFIGFEEKRMLATDFVKQPCLEISMKISNYFDDLVIVKEYLTDGINNSKSENSIRIVPKEMGSLPGQTEPEILDAIKFLPGIASPSGSADNICIRGGTPDQNLILWEDIPIYHSAHYFGMISAFNPYIIDEISVYRSGFDAKYGGRIAGVIDLKSKAFTEKKPSFNAGVNFLNAYANGKIPFFDNKASIIFSMRRSVAEIWRSPTYENITRQVYQGVLLNLPLKNGIPNGIEISDDFHFFDTNIKATFKTSERDEIGLAYFYGKNDFSDRIIDNRADKTQSDSLQLNNSGINFKWKHAWNKYFSSQIMGLNSDFVLNYNYLIEPRNDRPDKIGIKRSAINEKQFHFLNMFDIGENQLKVGYQSIKYKVDYLISRIVNDAQQAQESNKADAGFQVLYADFNREFNRKIGINAGLRLSYFNNQKDVFWEPRLRFWYQTNDHLNFNFSAGKYHQFLSRLVEIEGDKAGIDTPVWVLVGQENVPILTANQYQIGLVYQRKGWLVDLQVYTKKVKGVTSLATGFSENFDGNGFHVGDSNVKGLDVLIKKRWKRFRSWISYSQTKNDYAFRSFFDKSFPSPNDQRHILNIANSYSIGNFDISIGWKLSSGLPYSRRENFRIETTMQGMKSIETIEPILEELNTERLNLKHQADLSISYTIPKKNKVPSYYFGLSLYNLYNQTNLNNRSFFIDKKDPISQITYTDRGEMGFTPNFVVRLAW